MSNSNDLPQTNESVIEALKANIDGKAAVIEQLWSDLDKSKALNKALLKSCHAMHAAYGKPNLN